jgi:g-D-glutamyl-meso-diaminopimelate peptidase
MLGMRWHAQTVQGGSRSSAAVSDSAGQLLTESAVRTDSADDSEPADISGTDFSGARNPQTGSSGASSASGTADSSKAVTVPDVPYSEQGEAVWAGMMPPDGTEIVPIDHAAYTYEEMRRDLYLLTVRYPSLVSEDSLGVTADGRQIMEAVIGNTAAAKHIVLQYSMHAREYINTLLAMKSLELYLMNYETGTYDGQTYLQLFSNVCIHIIPMANPDGVTVAQSGTAGISRESLKKNLEDTYESDKKLGRTEVSEDVYFTTFKANARGVDLNKNFDVNWENYNTGVPFSSTDCYKGSEPCSEAETKAIVSLVDRINCVCFISYHAAGQTVYWNYGAAGEQLEADKVLGTMCANVTNYALKAMYTDSAKPNGGCSDYMELVRGIPSVTIETGKGTCPLKADQFPEILSKNLSIIPAAAEKYAS